MKNRMFKESLRAVVFLLLVCICSISFADAQPGNSMMKNLELRINTYKETFRSGDYTKAASFFSPNMINKIGGKENFAKLVQKFTGSTIITLKPSLIEFSKPEKIVRYNNKYISVTKQTIPITTKGVDVESKDAYLLFNPTFPANVFDGMDGVFNLSIVAFSEDDGNTWYLAGGNKMSLDVENIKSEILEKVNIPVPSLVFSEGNEKIVLYRQNKQWVRREPGKSEGLAGESIILTIGEQAENSQPGIEKQGVPDDSLDAYIYLEEHPDVLGKMNVEQDKPISKKEIINEDESKPEQSGNISVSVFVTNNSRVFHKTDCPELGTGETMEFDSADEALDAGGLPCNKCNQ
jgi:hypothetical protein